MLFAYALGFYIPFCIIVFADDSEILNGLEIVCLISQIVFFGMEIIQFRFHKQNYFKSNWNFVNVSQVIIYALYYILRRVQ